MQTSGAHPFSSHPADAVITSRWHCPATGMYCPSSRSLRCSTVQHRSLGFYVITVVSTQPINDPRMPRLLARDLCRTIAPYVNLGDSGP
jgi:hypothetical protein